MIINLTKIPSFWLTCEKTADRWPRMEEMLKNLEIPAEKINGALTNPYTLGVAQSNLEVLRANLDNPVLLLEDDCEVMGAYRDSLEVPDDADVLYLGTSHYGRRFGRTELGGVISKDEGEYLRIFNQLSLHAVVYISRRYKEHVISLLENFDGNGGGVDDRITDEMSNWKVLAIKKPFWAQNDGHSYLETATPLQATF